MIVKHELGGGETGLCLASELVGIVGQLRFPDLLHDEVENGVLLCRMEEFEGGRYKRSSLRIKVSCSRGVVARRE